MGISFRTQTFHDIKNKIAGDDVAPEQVEGIIESYGVNPDEYYKEYDSFFDKYEKGEVDPTEGFGPAPVAMVTSALGRAGKGIVEFGDMVLPESVSNTISNFADDVGANIPEEAKRVFQETFDPYHGEGLTGDIRNIGAEIGSYLIPYTGVSKVGKLAGLGKIGRNVAGIGAANLTYTAYERPEDNIANILVDKELLPKEYLDKIRSRTIDLDDPEEQQYIDQLVNNLALEGILGGVIVGGGKILKGLSKSLAPKIDEIIPFSKYFTATGGTDDTMLELAVKRDGAAAAAFTKVRGFNEPLEKELKDKGLYNDDYLEGVVNKALEGDETAKATLRADSAFAADTVDQMRNEIDTLSNFVKDNFIKDGSELKVKIGENIGTYLNRSYRAFDDPKYKFEDIPDDVKQRAAAYLRDVEGIPEENIGPILKDLASGKRGDQAEGIFKFLDNMYENTGSTSRVTRSRKDVPPEIRALWGEVKDPFKNFQNTLEKLSVFKAEYKYLDGVKRHLDANDLTRAGIRGAKRIVSPEPEAGLKSLGEAGEERMARIISGVNSGAFKNPLEGLYANKNYQKMVKDTLNQDGFFGANPNSVVRTFLKAKSISQVSKTVANPSTHFRNIMGNTVLMTANGMLSGGKGWKEATQAIGTKFKNVSSKELADNVSRYQELGIIDSGVTANIIRQVASDAFKSTPNGLMEKTLKRTGGDKLFKLYQAEDDYFKIIHFEKTKNYLKKAFPDIGADEIDRLAAQRTRDLMPNYNLVPKGFKKLRGAPVGDFLAFPAEMMRVTKNLVKYTMQDLASGNTRLTAEAMKRLGGITAAGIGGDMASDYTQSLYGISDEQKDAVNDLVPSYSAHSAKIFLSPFKKAGGNTVVDYVDLGPLDPFEYLKIGGRTLHRAVDKLYSDDQEFTTDDAAKLTLQLSDQMLGPFLGTSMITEGLIEALGGGQQDFETPTEIGDTFKNIAIGTGEMFEPGFLKFLRNRLKFQQAKAKALGEEGITFNSFTSDPTGNEVSKYGYSTPTGGLISGAAGVAGYDGLEEFFGLKRSRLDLTQGMRRNILPITGDIKNTGAYVNERLASYENQSPDVVYDAYVKGQEQKLSKFKKLQATLDAYGNIFQEDFRSELDRGLTQQFTRDLGPSVQELINAADANMFIPDGVSETMGRVRFATGAPLPLEDMNRVYQQLYGTAIREE
jgi:hypothetical protein